VCQAACCQGCFRGCPRRRCRAHKARSFGLCHVAGADWHSGCSRGRLQGLA
jgi:hypothetical protein